jgi:two-component system sensor histidine kinase AgrC
MDKVPVAAVIFQCFPESVALILFGFVLFNIKRPLKSLMLVASVYTFTTYIVRLLPIKFGIHSIILIFILALYMNIFAKIDFFKSIAISLTDFMILTLTESVMIWVIMEKLNLSYEALFNTPWDRIKFGLASPAFMLIITGIIALTKKRSGYPNKLSC